MQHDPRFPLWADAVRATYAALGAQSRAAWRAAATAWDTLVSMHDPTENDRAIYHFMAVQSWMQAADWRMKP
jgi:hypothetical protein